MDAVTGACNRSRWARVRCETSGPCSRKGGEAFGASGAKELAVATAEMIRSNSVSFEGEEKIAHDKALDGLAEYFISASEIVGTLSEMF